MADEDLTERQRMIKALRQTNAHILERITKAGGETTNVDAARHERFVAFLVEIGVIELDDAEAWTLLWLDEYNTILMNLEIELQKLVRANQDEQRRRRREARTAPRLLGPGGNPLR